MQSRNFIHNFYYDWWKNIDKFIFSLIILLFLIGLFFSLVSTSLIASDKLNTNSYYFFIKHFLFIGAGVFFIIFFSSLNYNDLTKISKILFVLFLFFLMLVPFFGVEVKGSKRWMEFFFLPKFQPIELLKPFLIVFIANILSNENNKNIYHKYFLSFLIIVPVILLLIIQPDFGMFILVFVAWLIQMVTSRLKLKIILPIL